MDNFYKNENFFYGLVENFNLKNKIVWFYTINFLSYFIFDITDVEILKRIFYFFEGYFKKAMRLTLIGSKILNLAKIGAEKNIKHFQILFDVLNNILDSNFNRRYLRHLNFNIFL